MVYLFGLAVVFIAVILFWVAASPTASRPELIIVEDDTLPPHLIVDMPPRTPCPGLDGGLEPAPGYTTRPATPRPMQPPAELELHMASFGPPVSVAPSSPIAIDVTRMPARPQTARRKHNQRRGGRVAEVAFIATV
ncbi:hypothetical protein CcaverHIS002_0701320 [Cutaneotrichosporon cavernicola]|uniref:Secreted protein n=1 Tax=Cutaneotrichosporon cavernicola TaxID=279322 RepID=A0AA48QYI2_9TREE|nr:uncharacterized protein CcaverHIS019_0701340 [Cutaneotrichosporon cavernicola]BEI86786.1 hypothetical protein CcaverHIS002_0701320 [Cutaneotrichosporon cavernicola]BEI94562.1 hypothetical protein CcaverHIS019_0701340 [Cutaneotrichosporon cavernicola]BEJ02338.1 hypothetical protein CcaverHIS631_0701330 [Cutaneotrichosporon cavernicola]BEJ10097.1 hypothetical protein CcaverHIS641_0701320 [Cutaneotrichosporon cavernicola]